MSRITKLVLLFHFFDKLLYFSVLPNVPIGRLDSGMLTTTTLAAFFLVHLLVYRGLNLWGGYLADQVSARFCLVLGCLLQYAGLVWLVFAPGLVFFLLAGVIVGIGGGLVAPALNASLARRSKRFNETKNFSTFFFLLNIGALAGPIWIWPQLGSKILPLAILNLLLMASLLKTEDFGKAAEKSNKLSFVETIQALLRHQLCVRFFLVSAAFMSCYTMIFSSIPVIAKGIGVQAKSNLWLALNAGTIVLFYYAVTKFTMRSKLYWRTIFIGVAIVSVGTLTCGLATSMWVLAGGVVILSLGELIMSPILFDYFNSMSPENMRGQFTSLVFVSAAVGEAGGQAFLTVLPNPRLICVVLAAVLLVGAVLFDRYQRRVTAAANSALESTVSAV